MTSIVISLIENLFNFICEKQGFKRIKKSTLSCLKMYLREGSVYYTLGGNCNCTPW